ncbi:hypothetical protein MBLNU230_g7581t1 [Neophaeotheca triangularis]
MPLRAPESYELEDDHRPLNQRSRNSLDDAFNSEDGSDIGDFDPLKGERAYTDDASQPLRNFDSNKEDGFSPKRPLAWLDGQRRKGTWQRWLIPSRFCCLLIGLFFLTLLMLLSAGGIWVYKAGSPNEGQSAPWYPSPQGGNSQEWRESYDKAASLVDQMTLVEKVNVTTGIGWSMGLCVGNTGPVDRLGFPSLCLQDGPLGLRFVDNATAWPAGITVGATWNKELMYERGKAQGLEARMKGIHVVLGPSMGPIGRLPAGGRNWEAFGPDPVLQGIAAAQTIKGIQDAGVQATAKHYYGNEQEHFRQSWEWATPNAISSNIDDRTEHEIYAWPFAEAIKAGVVSVMCSYNQVNNSYACGNSRMLNGILKDEMGFQGYVQSDWLAQRSGVASALAGLDMSQPGDGLKWMDGKPLWGSELTRAVLNESLPMDRLNDMTMRIVAAWYQVGQDNETMWPKDGGPNFSSWTDDKVGQLHPGASNSEETGVVNKFVQVRNTTEGGDHDILARKIAREGIVLVKNDDDFLPLSRNGTAAAVAASRSGKMKVGIFGEDAFSNPKGPNACEDRACNDYTLASGWGSGAVEFPYLVSPAEALRREFDSKTISVTRVKNNEDKRIDDTAAEQDMCLVFINSDSGEGYKSWNGVRGDRNDLHAQKDGDVLVQEVAGNCDKTIVVIHTVGPLVLEKWIDLPGVKGVLIAHLPGQESGNALADIIFGDENPSGRLPYTIAKKEEDYGPTSGILYYPNGVVPQQNFSEGLYFDYRHFDKYDITPRYEFGYGLSYTAFKLSSLTVQSEGLISPVPAERPIPGPYHAPNISTALPSPSEALFPPSFRKLQNYIYPYITSTSSIKRGKYPYPAGYDLSNPHPLSPAGGAQGGNPDLYASAATVKATVTNTGTRAGSCVVQLYISPPQSVKSAYTGQEMDMPVKVLRNWAKIAFEEGEEEREVELEVTRKDLSYWDVGAQNWVVPSGEFTVWVGFSSRDLPGQETFVGVAGDD